MNRKLYIILFACIFAMHAGDTIAQCPAGRYTTELFSSFTKDSAQFSSVYHLGMDIYQPTGDTIPARPLIILAHGGSFIQGNKSDDSTVIWLCRNFSRRGYVVASIDYRLDTNGTDMLDSVLAINHVIQAVSDGKAAIRFFKDSVNMLTYKIDTNNIFIGGNSAGAVLYMHVGYLDSLAECTTDIATAMAANGGFDGNSGYPGHSTQTKGVINLAGALHTTEFVGPHDIPSVNAQGDADIVVPYNCGYPDIGLPVPVELCGLGALEPAYVARGIYHMSHVFPGASHVPWATNPSDFYTVDSIVTQFLYNMVCTTITTEVGAVNTPHLTSVFPNPASDIVNIRSSELINEVSLFDNTGRVISNTKGISNSNFELNTSRLSPGIYFVKISYNNVNSTPEVKRVVIE